MFPDSPFAVPTSSFNSPVPVPTEHPNEGVLVSVCFNEKWLPYVIGSLKQLWLQTTWIVSDQAELDAVQQDAALLTEIFGEATMCCPCPTSKIVDGVPMYTFDGEHYFPYPGAMNDPALNGGPKWSTVPEGQTGQCLSAANFANLYKTSTTNFLTLLGADAAIGDFVGGVSSILAAFIEPVVILAWIVDFVAGMITATYDALADAATDENVHILQCAIECNVGSDGMVSPEQFDAIYASLGVSPGGAIGAYMQLYIYGFGPVGIMRGEKIGIVSADCSDCDCGWSTVLDFTTSDYSSFITTIQGAYSPGVGYVGTMLDVNSNPEIEIRAFFDATTVTRIKYYYSSTGGSGTNNQTRAVIQVGLVDVEVYGTLHTTDAGTDIGVDHSETHAMENFDIDVNNGSAGGTNLLSKIELYGNSTKPSQFP